MHEIRGKSFFFPMDKKMFSPYIKWCIGKCPGLCTTFSKLAHSTLSLCFITQLFRFVGILQMFLFLCPNCALGALKQ